MIKRKPQKSQLRAIATKAANKMERKKTWCQGSWALAGDGRPADLSASRTDEWGAACFLPSVAAMRDQAAREAGGEYVDSNYFQANSPKAQKFCVEGAIFNAAGKVYRRLVPGYQASRVVINLLDEKVEADPTTSFDSGQSLNDHNGDSSRKRLVGYLREIAKDLA